MAPRGKPKRLVVDASVLLAFYLPAEPYKEQALALLAEATAEQARLLVPTLARYEVLNALSRAVRGLRTGACLSLEEAQEILAALAGLPLEERPLTGLEEEILRLSQALDRTVYDAAYLALARKENVPFVTGDARLYHAVREKFPTIQWLGHGKP
ncbi:MAG: type II toxin-antitoxin system VapC family toxin [Candidatus Bipolaricaulaceae bacterium]